MFRAKSAQGLSLSEIIDIFLVDNLFSLIGHNCIRIMLAATFEILH